MKKKLKITVLDFYTFKLIPIYDKFSELNKQNIMDIAFR